MNVTLEQLERRLGKKDIEVMVLQEQNMALQERLQAALKRIEQMTPKQKSQAKLKEVK